MSIKVRTDLSGWKAIRKAVVKTESRVKVGILNDTRHESDGETESEISMLELAAIHEFGSPAANIPERSFIRATLNGKRDQINEAIEQHVGSAIKDLLKHDHVSESQAESAAKRALGKLGTQVVSMMRATIRDKATVGPEDQALKPATIARKGSSTPLVDTAQLVNAISYAVVDGKDVEGVDAAIEDKFGD